MKRIDISELESHSDYKSLVRWIVRNKNGVLKDHTDGPDADVATLEVLGQRIDVVYDDWPGVVSIEWGDDKAEPIVLEIVKTFRDPK